MSTRAKWILGIIGTVLLGALGSGLWDLCLRGIFVSIGHGILTLITLGIGSVRDSFYVEIAKGRTDRVGIYLVSFGAIFLGFLTGCVTALVTLGRRGGSVSDSAHRFLRWTVILILLFVTSMFSFRFALISYSTSAIDHFEQAYTICLPFMSPSDRDSIRSDFARIKTKGDYVAVLARLNEKAEKNKVELPKFSIW